MVLGFINSIMNSFISKPLRFLKNQLKVIKRMQEERKAFLKERMYKINLIKNHRELNDEIN